MERKSVAASAFSIVAVFICLMILGLVMLPTLPFRSRSSAELPAITVRVGTKGHLTPGIVENEVTNKLEQVLSRIENVKSITSYSYSNVGDIRMELTDKADIESVRFNVALAIRNIWDEIKDVAYYPSVTVSKIDGTRNTFMTYAIISGQSMDDLVRFVKKDVVDVLSIVKGVGNVSATGGEGEWYTLEFFPKQLSELGVTAGNIAEVIKSLNSDISLGIVPSIEDGGMEMNRRISLHTDGGLDDIMAASVATRTGDLIPLSSLLGVVDHSTTEASNIRINGKNTILVNISAQKNASEITVGENVRKAMDKIKEKLPPDTVIQLRTDDSVKIKKELENIIVRSSLTFLILAIFVILSVRQFRVVLMIMISLGASLLIGVIGYKLFGVEMNMYALAGISLSLSVMVDNSIVMADSLIRRGEVSMFQPMLAATMTTIGAMTVVLFLDNGTQLILKDVALITIINLGVSLLTASVLVPALGSRMNIAMKSGKRKYGRRTRMLFSKGLSGYGKTISFLSRHKVIVLTVVVLVFGLPLYLMPREMERGKTGAKLYNKIFGTEKYNDKIKPLVNKYLGGSLFQLHTKGGKKSSSFGDTRKPEEIYIGVSLPQGAQEGMLDIPVRGMESFLSTMPGIEKFETNISGNENASMVITFEKDAVAAGVPMTVRKLIVDRALVTSGLTWSVNGPGDERFTNTPGRISRDNSFLMKGYNYSDLLRYAEQVVDSISENIRVRDVAIGAGLFGDPSHNIEYSLKFSPLGLDGAGISLNRAGNAVSNDLGNGAIQLRNAAGGKAGVILKQASDPGHDLWEMMNGYLQMGEKSIKLSEMAGLQGYVSPMEVVKTDQQYIVNIAFNFKGDYGAVDRLIKRTIDSFSEILPMGYSIEYRSYRQQEEKGMPFYVVIIIIAIIYMTASVISDSLFQPLAIIMTIPVSFIGMFFTFAYMGLPFEEGAAAALILLAGLTVNAGIYLAAEYNGIRKRRPALAPQKAFTKALARKSMPIFLTILSTILGFLPFVVSNDDKEGFWFTFSMGTIAGLAASFIGVYFLLPALLLKGRKKRKRKRKRKLISLLKLKTVKR